MISKEIISKICTKCKLKKSLDEFKNDKTRKDHKCPYCKKCIKKYRIKHKVEIQKYQNKYNKKYRQINKEKLKTYYIQYAITHKKQKAITNKIYCRNNQKKIKQRRQIYYIINKTKRFQYHKRWRQLDHSKIILQIARQKRRALELELGGEFTNEQWQDKLQEYNYRCVDCNRTGEEAKNKKTNKLTIDHIIPPQIWKEWWFEKNKPNYKWNDIENIEPMCHSCNASKNNKIL